MTTPPVPDARAVSHAEARAILSRFNASHWNNPGEHARYTIPADPERDDDIRLARYIDENERMQPVPDARALAAWERELVQMNVALDAACGGDCVDLRAAAKRAIAHLDALSAPAPPESPELAELALRYCRLKVFNERGLDAQIERSEAWDAFCVVNKAEREAKGGRT